MPYLRVDWATVARLRHDTKAEVYAVVELHHAVHMVDVMVLQIVLADALQNYEFDVAFD